MTDNIDPPTDGKGAWAVTDSTKIVVCFYCPAEATIMRRRIHNGRTVKWANLCNGLDCYSKEIDVEMAHRCNEAQCCPTDPAVLTLDEISTIREAVGRASAIWTDKPEYRRLESKLLDIMHRGGNLTVIPF